MNKLISVIPAQPGYFVSIRQSGRFKSPPGAWEPWAVVIAWGFSANDPRPSPLSLKGAPREFDEDYRIKTPEGEVVEA